MALITKLVEGTGADAGKFIKADGTVMDAIMPTTPLADSTSNLVRVGIWAGGTYLFTKKKLTGNFF